MPITHGLILNSSFVSSTGSLLQADTPIGLIGTAASGANNQIIRVRSSNDLMQFGDRATGSIVKALEVLQDYGCNNVYVIKVPTGIDAAATATNIIGAENSGVKTGMQLFKDVWSIYREKPQLLLVPGYNTDAILTAILAVASNINVDALVLSSFTLGTSLGTATTIRATTTGLGIKDARLIPCLIHLKNSIGEFVEPATHAAGLIAQTTLNKGFGYSPSNKPLINVSSIEAGFTLSYVDENADNQKAENLGIFSINMNSDGYVGWGNRNALFVDNVNESFDSYIVLQRIEQVLNAKFEKVERFYIDEPCNFNTGKALETALRNTINDNSIPGNLVFGSTAFFNLQRTNYAARELAYDIVIVSDLPTELITTTVQYTVQM